MMTVAQIVVRIRQKALIPPRMYSSFPCGLALPLTMALTFSVREPAMMGQSSVCQIQQYFGGNAAAVSLTQEQ